MTSAAIVGFYGKLPGHGDFVRRGLPVAPTTLLDDWMQRELARVGGSSAIDSFVPVRFAATTLVADHLALGALISSADSVGRTYMAVAMRLSAHSFGILPDPVPSAWDDWSARAEAVLIAARDGNWTADATQAALEASAAGSVVAIAPPPVGVPDDDATVVMWRPGIDGAGIVLRTVGLPCAAAFDSLLVASGCPA